MDEKYARQLHLNEASANSVLPEAVDSIADGTGLSASVISIQLHKGLSLQRNREARSLAGTIQGRASKQILEGSTVDTED